MKASWKLFLHAGRPQCEPSRLHNYFINKINLLYNYAEITSKGRNYYERCSFIDNGQI
jgi:hypothetical protein